MHKPAMPGCYCLICSIYSCIHVFFSFFLSPLFLSCLLCSLLPRVVLFHCLLRNRRTVEAFLKGWMQSRLVTRGNQRHFLLPSGLLLPASSRFPLFTYNTSSFPSLSPPPPPPPSLLLSACLWLNNSTFSSGLLPWRSWPSFPPHTPRGLLALLGLSITCFFARSWFSLLYITLVALGFLGRYPSNLYEPFIEKGQHWLTPDVTWSI